MTKGEQWRAYNYNRLNDEVQVLRNEVRRLEDALIEQRNIMFAANRGAQAAALATKHAHEKEIEKWDAAVRSQERFRLSIVRFYQDDNAYSRFERDQSKETK